VVRLPALPRAARARPRSAKAGRFSYWRCPDEHGRLTPFFQFLREKQFVRSLTPAELGACAPS
jgi:hypothetical protein